MDIEQEERLWTTQEVLQVLYGLSNVYLAKNWFARILFKPWNDALQTAAMIIGGNVLMEQADNAEFMTDIEKYVNN